MRCNECFMLFNILKCQKKPVLVVASGLGVIRLAALFFPFLPLGELLEGIPQRWRGFRAEVRAQAGTGRAAHG